MSESPEGLRGEDAIHRVDVSSSVIALDEEPDQGKLESWLLSAMDQLSLAPCVVSVHLVSPDEIRELNHRYRQVDQPTNVLSFEADVMVGAGEKFLGDIIICTQVVLDESLAYGKSFEARFAHMLIHGLLHLLGFDHQGNLDRERMETTECQLLAAIGFADPYDID